eukprot:scaffold9223_cov46-Attheya_sp.AAC.3
MVITDVASTAASSRLTKKCKLIAYEDRCPLPHVQSGRYIEMNSNTQLRMPRAELPDWAVGIHARITSSSHLMWQNRNTLVVTKSP